uniref:Uncharacterized protein n=1 Tax=Rhizophora mucronata TaxID=61149 RepID=A0A2P2IZ24_RHIMU
MSTTIIGSLHWSGATYNSTEDLVLCQVASGTASHMMCIASLSQSFAYDVFC